MDNIIITSHSGVGFGSRENIFFNSLRKYYNGEILVFTNNNPNHSFIEKSEIYKYRIIPYPCKIHHCVDRFFYWHHFLKSVKNSHEKIFFIDLVDTYWQKYPFDFDRNLEFSIEKIKIKDCPINKDWFIKFLGEDIGNKFIDENQESYISCAGAIRGHYNDIIEYLEYMTENLKYVTSNLDQAVHNLYYNIKKNQLDIESDELCTVGYQKYFQFDSFGNLLENNKIVTRIHQYVHHNILNLISKKYE